MLAALRFVGQKHQTSKLFQGVAVQSDGVTGLTKVAIPTVDMLSRQALQPVPNKPTNLSCLHPAVCLLNTSVNCDSGPAPHPEQKVCKGVQFFSQVLKTTVAKACISWEFSNFSHPRCLCIKARASWADRLSADISRCCKRCGPRKVLNWLESLPVQELRQCEVLVISLEDPVKASGRSGFLRPIEQAKNLVSSSATQTGEFKSSLVPT